MSSFSFEHNAAGSRSSGCASNAFIPASSPAVYRCSSSSCLFSTVMNCCAFLKAVRCTIGIWLLSALIILLSMRIASPNWMRSNVFVLLLLLFQCGIRGTLCPRPVVTSMRSSVVVVIVIQGVLAPFLAVSLYPFSAVWCGEGLTRGMLYISCLPPSSLLAVWVVKEASGHTFLCRYAMLYFIPFFCLWTPFLLFLMSFLPFTSSQSSVAQLTQSNPSFSYLSILSLVLVPVLFCVCFFVGVMAKVFHARTVNSHRLEDVSLKQYISVFSDSGFLSEVLEISQEKWRFYSTTLSFFLLIFTNYVVLSALLHSLPFKGISEVDYSSLSSTINSTFTISSPSSTENISSSLIQYRHGAGNFRDSDLKSTSISPVSAKELFAFSLLLLLWQSLLHGATWYLLRCSNQLLQKTSDKEDSIALLFSSTFKCEALLIPLSFFFSFGRNTRHVTLDTDIRINSGNFADVQQGIFIASLLYFGLQSFATLLIIPLKRWRMYANCRPGTVMFPLSYDRFYRSRTSK